MLNRIIAFALRNRGLVLVVSLLVAFYGGWVALRMPIDVLPNLNRPTVTVMTEAHAMIPEDVERLVTRPVEQLLAGATGVLRVRSSSGLGLSIIFVEFDWGTDIFRDRQIVQEKLQLAQASLPPGIQPQMAPIASVMGQVQLIGIQSNSGRISANDLRAIADVNVKQRLKSIAGVAQIVSIGGAPRQLQVIADSDKLATFDVTLADVAAAVRASNLNVEGGLIEIGSKGPLVTVAARIRSPADVEVAVVKSDPIRPVRVADVARVDFGPAALRTGEAGVNARPGVILVVFKQPGVDTTDLTDRVNAELRDIGKGLPADVAIVDDLFQQAQFIHRAIDNVEHAVRDGAILVVVVLFIFLMNFRTTLITLTAIPLSIAITALVFRAFGLTINTMTLGGLAVAIGALVDDAIVDVENVFRRLRENAARPDPESRLRVIFRASSEVRNPILVGTLLVVVVYIPLFFLTGMEGALFTPIGLAYIISTVASLVVSLTVTPVLCRYLLGGRFVARHRSDGWLVRALKRGVGSMIRFGVNHPLPVMGIVLALVAAGVVLFATQGSQFLPAFNEGSAQVNLILPPETSLKVSDAYGQRLEKIVASVPGVKSVGRRTGRAEGDEHAEGVGFSEAIVIFDPASKRSREEVIDEIRDRLAAEFPGVATEVEQPLAHLLSHMLSGVNAQVAIKIFGPNLDVLRRTAAEVEAAVRGVPGVRDLFTETQALVDQVQVTPQREQLARAGLNASAVAETVELAFGAEEISRMSIDQVGYPVVLRLEERDRRDLTSLRNLMVRADDGSRLRLSDLAAVDLTKTPSNINREGGVRRIVVQHNVSGRSLSEVVGDVERVIAPIRDGLAGTPGYSIRISGQFEAQQAAARLIAALSGVALAAMLMILYAHFRSFNLSVQVLLSVPAAFIGAVAYIVVGRQTPSVATLVGLISLAGIATRNAILLIDHYVHLMREEGATFGEEMIVRAGQERMVPVLMTALCSAIALVPLALSPDQPGREILHPVATVIIGGLASSTLLEFLLRPAVFSLFGRKAAERLVRRRARGGHPDAYDLGEQEEDAGAVPVPAQATG